MKHEPSAAKQASREFALLSLATLQERRSQLDAELKAKVSVLRSQVKHARALRGEESDVPEELLKALVNDDLRLREWAARETGRLEREEEDSVSADTTQAIFQSPRGLEVRRLLGELKEVEERLERLEKELGDPEKG